MNPSKGWIESAYVTTVRLNSADPVSFDTDALVVGFHSTPEGPRATAPGLEDAFGGKLNSSLAAMNFTGKPGDLAKLPTFGAITAPLLVAVGLGDSVDLEGLRRAAGSAVHALDGTAAAALALPATTGAEVEAIALGALLGAYGFARYQTKDGQKLPVADVTVLSSAEDTTARAAVIADAVALVRDLVNTPPSDLNPATFAELAESTGVKAGLTVEILDEKALKDGGYGGIVGVGQGSANPPRLVRLSYTHPEAVQSLAYVGKGITFDSGGLSIKPSAGMDAMKSDMGGAGAVLGALVAIARLAPKVNVTGYLCLAENLPSGTATRPSDVLRSYSGKTVEVLDTDAEGRLVLMDGIARAAEDHPDLIVDVATLTGAQMVALGLRTSGVMANDDEARELIVEIAGEAGEGAWGMPLPEELRKGLDSSIADIANLNTERWGGMLSAAVFLQEFVPEGQRWAHIDIAGPAFNRGPAFGYTPKGGTGVITRTLIGLAERHASGFDK